MDSLFPSEAKSNPLRQYQTDALAALRSALVEGYRRPLVQMPTGSGKSRLAAEIVRMARAKDKRVVFCVPAISLIDQSLAEFAREGIRDIGIIQANHHLTDYALPVQIASVQTIARRGFPDCDLVIVDEAHRRFETLEKWMSLESSVKKPFIGLSATPWSKGLGNWFDKLVIAETTQGLIDQGYLSPFRVFAPAHPDLKGVRTTAGDYREDDLSNAMNKDVLVADIVETWIRQGEGRPTLCFAVDCAHAQHLQERFNAAGINAGYIDAHTELADRAIIRQKFLRRELHVVCNVGVLTIGVDWPEISCLILARPTKSEILHVQIVGRALRLCEAKSDALILDHSDNHHRLGFVTGIVHEHLDDGTAAVVEKKAAEKKEPLPKECPKCAYLRPAKVHICPNCGFEAKRQTEVTERDGVLQEITKGSKANLRPGYVTMQGEWIACGDFYGMLKKYAKEKKYNPHWADNQYKSCTGTWPNFYKSAPEREVSYSVASWIRSRQIRYIKGKQKAEASQRSTEPTSPVNY